MIERPTNGTGKQKLPERHWAESGEMESLVDDFLYFQKHRRSASQTTIETYDYILKGFGNYLGGREITLKEIDNYAKQLAERGLAPKTYRCKLSVIKSFVKYLYIHDLTTIKPEAIILPKDKHIEASFLEVSEAHRLISVIDSVRDKAMIMVLLTSGVRASELINLRYEDLYERSIIVRNGKGDKPRIVFITPETQVVFDHYLQHRGNQPGYMFPNPHGDKLSRQLICRKVSFYAAKAGIDKRVSTHTLRHTMATTMLRNGARVEDVQQILGHTNIRNTLLYLHFTNDLLQKSYRKHMDKQGSLTKIA